MAPPMKPSRARLLTIVAATVVSLACGTNYVYSAWGPQFAQRLKLSATESNLIGTAGNLGMYVTGIPLGMMVDRVGPRPGIALSVILFMLGYYPLARAFDAGPGAFNIWMLTIFSFFTGAGSNSGFISAIKVAAMNYPEARGSATAFPLAAFGLSAFAFATLALALPHNTGSFLKLLATGTVLLPALSFPFMKLFPAQKPSYKGVSQNDTAVLHRTRSPDMRHHINHADTGAQDKISPFDSQTESVPADARISIHSSSIPRSLASLNDVTSDENSSLLSSSSSSTDLAHLEACKSADSDRRFEPAHLDIRGFALLKHAEFYQLFGMLGLLTGIGLMTINNIGNDATALWRHFDPTKDSAFIAKRQVMHVSILSVCSFTGRLLSGIGSDILVNRYNRSRFWCLLASAVGFTIAQILAINIETPTLLVLVSGLTGLSYGMLFGVYPSIVAHTFGVHGISQNWGTMCLSPVISGNLFNLLYGRIYDSHSTVEDNGDRDCIQGKSCYKAAYMITLCSGLAGCLVCLWSIRHENQVHRRESEKGRRRSDHERVA